MSQGKKEEHIIKLLASRACDNLKYSFKTPSKSQQYKNYNKNV